MSKSNHLKSETSPYLKQHAHNPVDWYPWSDEALALAQKKNKLLLISIGYSACHWCHVMERESFEDEATAQLMNERFVCIKVDREERPDIDQVYMHAVQLISGQGGWPLNCFALPDGRPLYGGTYFRTEQWKEVLLNLSDLYQKDPEKVYRYAKQLTEGIQQSELVKTPTGAGDSIAFSSDDFKTMCELWEDRFDREEGGTKRAPKFPLPNNWQFLLRYGFKHNPQILTHVLFTLDKMAYGGIYDQLGGGFARYSTDSLWKAPHFEKMLYDNAQLVELYSEAFQLTQNPLYARVIRESTDFIERELTSPEGVFYSALDADSEGEEGKFYVWTKEELEKTLGELFPIFRDAYSVNSEGYWEEGNYILLRKKNDAELAEAADLALEAWQQKIALAQATLFEIRSKRIRPGLDDKILVSWNCLMVKAYTAAYQALGDREYLRRAEQAAHLILQQARKADGGLYRTLILEKANFENLSAAPDKQSTRINGFLEDYALLVEALLALYQVTFLESWLTEAKTMADYAILHFEDSDSHLFYFTSDLDKPLVARKMEIMDNVMPSSNSVMAKNLFILGTILGERRYSDQAAQMLSQVKVEMPKYGSGYSNWAQLALYLSDPFFQIVVTGPEAELFRQELAKQFLPQKIIVGATTQDATQLPLFLNRISSEKTAIYICVNHACKLPVHSVAEALAFLSH